MIVHLRINGQDKDIVVQPNETLMSALRRAGYYSVKHGCETGECGACGVLMKFRPAQPAEDVDAVAQPASFCMVNTCVTLAAQAQDAEVVTVESMGDRKGLSTIQQCFIDNG